MKKIVAVLLSMSFVLGLVACTKETEETKKKKKKKKSTTTETVESTEEPSDTSETGETDTTTTTDPSVTDPENEFEDVLVYDDSLWKIYYEMNHIDRAYGVTDPNSEENYGIPMNVGVYEYVDYIDFDTNLMMEFFDSVNGVFDDAKDIYDRAYAENLSKFLDDIDEGNELSGAHLSFRTMVTRADSGFFSMVTTEYDPQDYKVYRTSYNYCAACGREIAFDDVVEDREGLRSLVYDQLANAVNNYYKPTTLLDQISDGTAQFTLSYDGIYLYEENTYAVVKVSAIGNPDLFNMGYFGRTPQSYVLQFGVDNKLFWDLDGDGSTDVLELDLDSYDDYEFSPITFVLNGTPVYTASTDIDDELYGSFETAYFFETGNEKFVFITTLIEDDYEYQFIFRMNDDGSFKYVGPCYLEFADIPYDPINVNMLIHTDIVGTYFDTASFSFVDTDGEAVCWNSMIPRSGRVLVMNQGIIGTLLDDDLRPQGDKEVPIGSSVRVVGYEKLGEDDAHVFLEVLFPNSRENYTVVVDFSCESWPGKIDGIDVTDLFTGIQYAG